MKLCLGPSDISDAIQSLSASIADCFQVETPLKLVGIRSRGDEVAERLLAELKSRGFTQVELGVLDISLYRDDFAHLHETPTLQSTEIPFSIEGADLVIVDDVLFTGRTIRAALDALADYGRPQRIQLAVLIDRGHRELPIQADYAGISLDTERSDHVEVKLLNTDGSDSVSVLSQTSQS